MKKTRIVIIAFGLVALVVVAATVFFMARTAATPHNYADAKKMTARESCEVENSAASLPSADEEAITMAAMSYLTDVPAGTQADTAIAEYNGNSAVGSIAYPAEYGGSYNFSVTKQDASWSVTRFIRCS
jgi:hypothetical protein